MEREIKSRNLLEIERSIRALSLEEQLWLLEKIARRMRERIIIKNKLGNAKSMEKQLTAMANDANIQAEIAAINEEFAFTEMDGLY